MIRRWILTMVLILVIPISCFAADNLCEIHLAMRYDGRTVSGGTVTLYEVTDLQTDTDLGELAKYVKKNLPGKTKQVDSAGTVSFEGLEPGRYLLVQENAADGFLPMKPFLIQLPMALDGQQVYEITASPKLEPEKKLPQTGQLIWPAWAFLGVGFVFIGIGLINRKREG